MVQPILSLSPRKGRWLNKKSPSGSAALSRSTSAESMPSDVQGSNIQTSKSSLSSLCSDDACLQRSSTQSYAGKTHGLPEYDYPTPWSIAESTNLTGNDFPTPLVVKNTFVNFDIGRPASLEEFFEERLTKSCPGSGVSMPSDSKNASAVSDFPHQAASRETPRFLPPPPAKPPALHMNYSSPISPAPLHAPPTFDIDQQSFAAPPTFDVGQQSFAAPAPLYAPAHAVTDLRCQSHTQLQEPMLDGDWPSFVPLSRHDAAPHTVVLDLHDAICAHLEPVQEAQVLQHCPRQLGQLQEQEYMQQRNCDAHLDGRRCLPGFLFATYENKAFTPHPEAEIVGTCEYPTVGSQGHWSGNCKPCAFFHTKGCGNGTSCVFCHLCEQGAKKKRTKERRERRFRPQYF